jgi:hypothetical protein
MIGWPDARRKSEAAMPDKSKRPPGPSMDLANMREAGPCIYRTIYCPPTRNRYHSAIGIWHSYAARGATIQARRLFFLWSPQPTGLLTATFVIKRSRCGQCPRWIWNTRKRGYAA